MDDWQAKDILAGLKGVQEAITQPYYPCPRCGQMMKAPLEGQALSRQGDVYICSNCGLDEAVRTAMGLAPLPLVEWWWLKFLQGETA